MKVLCLSASLRNIRHGLGSEKLIKELREIETRTHLNEFLNDQAQYCLSVFVEAGRREKKSFNIIRKNLKKHPGTYGLSNSEVMLAAGIWGVQQSGIDVEHVNLSEYINKKTEILLEKVKHADGILLSGPVYFGDRSSLAHDFFQLLKKNRKMVQGKYFAGISVGAKRNGGQETCLIYKMMDFMNLGFLAVGNDTETTSQYGGTGHAGDVGSAAKDEYGITTSIGTGKRIAQVIKIRKASNKHILKDKPKIGLIILQDREGRAKRFIKEKILDSELSQKADFKLFYFVNEQINRCLACDMCPQHIGKDEDYRCIIRGRNDLFFRHHKELVGLDAILLGGYSTDTSKGFKSIYQEFMERTRYLRRSDYVFSNSLVAPFLFQDFGSQENLHIRILTSMIRHHTIMHRPIIFHVQKNELVYTKDSFERLDTFIDLATHNTAGRIVHNSTQLSYEKYLPYGYTLSNQRDQDPESVRIRKENMKDRVERYSLMRTNRLKK